MRTDTKDILIINDFAGYGRVSTQAMIPVLSYYGHHTYSLPTALVSNTLEYGTFEIHDTTGYMKEAVSVWKSLGFHFDNISVGFINSGEQVSIIKDLIRDNSPEFVLVDPIMAEDGKLYDGMYEGVIGCNRELASSASMFIPNVTEACLLTDMFVGRTSFTSDEIHSLACSLLELGPKDLVITGCETTDIESAYNYVYDSSEKEFIKVFYDKAPVSFIGTGDIFSGILAAESLCGNSVAGAVKTASGFISKVLFENIDAADRYDLHFEKYLSLLNKVD